MESDEEPKETSVRDLQAALFPIASPRGTGGFFANFLLKSPHAEDDDNFRLPKIKESHSRELFSLNKEQTCGFQLPRWPTECQVIEERVVHINYTPSTPEPYYLPTGNEAQPKPIGDECGIVVYQYYPISAVNYFSRSSIGGSKYLLPTCPNPEEDTLRFESRFESGNLAKAIRITPNYYELYLRTDLYTNKHCQWFYFKVTNTKKNFLYRFSIVNLSKDDSLYNEGMKPLMYSTKDSQLHCVGWRHCGSNITYYSNDNVTPEDPDQQMTYTLTFTLEFPHEGDAVYLAHSYPYTYSDLQDYLVDLSEHPVKSTFSTLRLLCKTLAGNNVYYVTVTAPPSPEENKKKRAVVITARVHPGETPASWMMKGVLDFLTGDSSAAKELREKFIFKIVPMLNPDGVIVGNNRCSLTGRDLNRQYRTVIRETYPSIWYTKLMVRRLLEECGVAMYCDLHAHSRKHNIFIFGCENRRAQDKRLYEQVFPLMLHKNAADKFSFENCHFRIHRSKEGTGRVVMWMMGIANSYTMEATFGGTTTGSKSYTHFSPQDYEQMGRVFCQTLLDFYDDDPRKEKLRTKIITRLLQEGSKADEPTNIKLSDYSSDEGDTSSSSGNEDYKRVYQQVSFTVPPPSPAIQKKTKASKGSKKKPPPSKSPNIMRKPLRVCHTTLELAVANKVTAMYLSETSDSNSDSECNMKTKARPRHRRKKKKKKKQKDTKVQRIQSEYKKTTTQHISTFDLNALGKFRAHSWHRSIVASPHKTTIDTKRITTQQLIEVQAKLNSLRNRLWIGTGDQNDDAPLSWGSTNFSVPATVPVPTIRVTKTKKKLKPEKPENTKLSKKVKHTDEQKEKNLKKSIKNGLKRQTAVDWTPMTVKVQKARSLPDARVCNQGPIVNETESFSCDEGAKAKAKKKKKKKSKTLKKVKTT